MIKIIEQSSQRLLLRQNRLSFGRLFREMLLAGIGLNLLLWLGPAKLDCQRVEPRQITCQLSKPGWLGLGIWRHQTIPNLQGVTLTETLDEGMYYQIRLQTSVGEVPLRPYKTSGLDNTKESADRIQTFLNDPSAKSLSIAQVDWLQWFGFAPGVFFAFVGLRLLYISLLSVESRAIEAYHFDQSQNQLTYEYGGLWRRAKEHHAFSDIQQIMLDIDPWAKVRLLMELRSGAVLCLNGQFYPVGKSLWQGGEWQQLQPIADAVSLQTHRPWKLTLGFGQSWLQKQIVENKYASAIARFFKASLEPSKVWLFDQATRSATCQQTQTRTTDTWNDIVDVQVIPSEPLTPKYDSDGDKFYTVHYQLSLVRRSGENLPVQQFSNSEYKWEPDTGKPSTAETWAEATAQHIRQFMGIPGRAS